MVRKVRSVRMRGSKSKEPSERGRRRSGSNEERKVDSGKGGKIQIRLDNRSERQERPERVEKPERAERPASASGGLAERLLKMAGGEKGRRDGEERGRRKDPSEEEEEEEK